MNKKNFNVVAIIEGGLGAVLLLVCIGVMLVGGYVETHYTKECVVIDVVDDVVVVEDNTENLWDFFGEGYQVGENVKVTFYTNHTDNTLYDDEIVSVKVKP